MVKDAEAIADCSVSLDRDPKSASSLFIRGLAKRQVHDTRSGDQDIATAETID